MIGYQVQPVRSQDVGFQEESARQRAFRGIYFLSARRALEEGQRFFRSSDGEKTGLHVSEAQGLKPYVVHWSEHPEAEVQEDLFLLPPDAVASSVIDLYVHCVNEDGCLLDARPATPEELEARSA